MCDCAARLHAGIAELEELVLQLELDPCSVDLYAAVELLILFDELQRDFAAARVQLAARVDSMNCAAGG